MDLAKDNLNRISAAGTKGTAKSTPSPAAVLLRPKRVQLSRQKGYKKPNGAISVVRPLKWGNPFHYNLFIDILGGNKRAAIKAAAQAFEKCLLGGGMPQDPAIREKLEVIKRDIGQLRGKDLACWCPLDKPCHADTLLRFANAEAVQ